MALADRAAFRLLIVHSALVFACASPAPPAASAGALEPGQLARVGSVALPESLVADVARSQGVTARAALDKLVEDALVAQSAVSKNLIGRPSVGWACTSALARRVPVRLADAAKAAGPPTDEEMATLSVVHAVVLRSRGISERVGAAIAAGIARAVEGAATANDFEGLASAVPHGEARVTIQRVPPFGAEGLMTGGGRLDPSFVAAAFMLAAPGTTSPVIESRFGWHVIRLIERVPPDRSSIEDRRRAISPAVLSLRARAALDSLLRLHRRKTEVSVTAEAETLTALAAASPP